MAQLAEPEVAVPFRRRTNTEQGNAGIAQSVFVGHGRGETAAGDGVAHQFLETRLVKGSPPVLDVAYLQLVTIYSGYPMTEMSQARGRHAAYITEAENGNVFAIRRVRQSWYSS